MMAELGGSGEVGTTCVMLGEMGGGAYCGCWWGTAQSGFGGLMGGGG